MFVNNKVVETIVNLFILIKFYIQISISFKYSICGHVSRGIFLFLIDKIFLNNDWLWALLANLINDC